MAAPAIALLRERTTAETTPLLEIASIAALAPPPSCPSHATYRQCNPPPHGLSSSYPNSTIIIKRLPTSLSTCLLVMRAILSISSLSCFYRVSRARAHARVVAFSAFPSKICSLSNPVSFTTNNDETSGHRFANLTLERVIYTIDRRKFFCETSYLLVQCSTFSFTMMISITTNCCAVVCELKRKCDARYNIHARARTRPRAPIVPRFSFLFILS